MKGEVAATTILFAAPEIFLDHQILPLAARELDTMLRVTPGIIKRP